MRNQGKNQRFKREQKRIGYEAFKIIGMKKLQKVLADRLCPGAGHYAKAGLKLLEGNLHAIHGHVFEDKNDDEHGKQQQVKLPMVEDSAPPFAPG